MTTISYWVRQYIEEKPYLQEALRQGIINHAALAEQIKGYLDNKLRAELKHISIVMAIRRYQEKMQGAKVHAIHFGKESEASLKTNRHLFTVQKSPTVVEKLTKLTQMIDFTTGGVFHVVQGNYQVSIITNSHYADSVREELQGENILREYHNLVSISLKYADTMIETPGMLFMLTRTLAWENISIITMVETMSETIFLVKEKDATHALTKLSNVMKQHA